MTDKPESAPREWWIAEKNLDDNEYTAIDLAKSELIKIPPEHHGYHVIERSYADKLERSLGECQALRHADCLYINQLAEERDKLEREVAAYKKAKAENDERFMLERDDLKRELSEVKEISSANDDRVNAFKRMIDTLKLENEKLRAADQCLQTRFWNQGLAVAEAQENAYKGEKEIEYLKREIEKLRGEVERLQVNDENWTEMRKWKPYLHFCTEWDGLCIDLNDPEFDACLCFDPKPLRGIDAMEAERDKLRQDLECAVEALEKVVRWADDPKMQMRHLGPVVDCAYETLERLKPQTSTKKETT